MQIDKNIPFPEFEFENYDMNKEEKSDVVICQNQQILYQCNKI